MKKCTGISAGLLSARFECFMLVLLSGYECFGENQSHWHADIMPHRKLSFCFLKGFHNHASHVRSPNTCTALMLFSSVLELLKCKSSPHRSRKAIPLERDHVTSDVKQITSAHLFLCLRFRMHGDKIALQQHAYPAAGGLQPWVCTSGWMMKTAFPLTVSEELCSRNFLSGSCLNRWRASALHLLAPEPQRESEHLFCRASSLIVQFCCQKGAAFSWKKNLLKVLLIGKKKKKWYCWSRNWKPSKLWVGYVCIF